jgi:hypothetical protein
VVKLRCGSFRARERVRAATIACALSIASCSPIEGTVLVVRERAPDASGDASSELAPEAGSDAASDVPIDGGEAPRPGDGGVWRPVLSACRIAGAQDGFFEEFSGSGLDPARWLVAHGAFALDGRAPRGGFVRDNVSVEAGALVLRVRGDRYAGAVRGIEANGAERADGRRTAAAVATRDLFASGTYSAALTLRGPAGVEVGMWLLRDGDSIDSIDIGSPALEGASPSGARVRMRTRGSNGGESELVLPLSVDTRAIHGLRFDWYTHEPESVRFWIDDQARVADDQRAPSGEAGRMWLVAWVPEGEPADFDSAEVRVERTFLTPFGNRGDRCAEAAAPPQLTLP